tara:strand:- start:813 stop:1232 length:420 start_codon:yes stop_codon:yes gene_type:complete
MIKDLFTELTTINDKTLQIDVISEETTETELLTFTSKLSLTKYLDRLRKNLYKTDVPICINDTIRNITVKFNLDTHPTQPSRTIEKRLRDNNLRFNPKSMVRVEKSSRDIKKEQIKSIMRDIRFGDMNLAKNKLSKYFG